MLIYLDMCCLKRPFDDQSQPRIRLETEAVLGLLSVESETVRFVRSHALLVENSVNPVRERASRVSQWLMAAPLWRPTDREQIEFRISQLMQLGLKNFDALHVACAEQAQADRFACCDDRLIAAARRNADQILLPVVGITELAREVLL